MARTRKTSKTAPTASTERPQYVGYRRVSTSEQGDSGLSLEHQGQQIDGYAQQHGIDVVHVVEIASAASVTKRPALSATLAALAAGEYAGLVVTKLDRLSRSALDFANLAAQAEREGWSLVVLDLGLDMGTAMGRFVAQIMSSVAELERRMISDRTKAGMAVAKARGTHCGAKSKADPALVARVVAERQSGSTFRAIAEALNADQILTPGGRTWGPGNVHSLLQTAPARALVEQAA